MMLGITINLLTWALLVASVSLAWIQLNKIHDKKENSETNTSYNTMLTASVLGTVATAAVTLSVIFYTLRFKKMDRTALLLFFLEWGLITASTVSYWLVSTPVEIGSKKYLNGVAITSTIALALFSIYFWMESREYVSVESKKEVKIRKLKKEIIKAKI
jgi:uncharacterized membrane protein